jgi:hypothetical protein
LEIGLAREIASGCSRAVMRWRDAFECDRRRASLFRQTSLARASPIGRHVSGHESFGQETICSLSKVALGTSQRMMMTLNQDGAAKECTGHARGDETSR